MSKKNKTKVSKPEIKKVGMRKEELEEKHALYKVNIEEWQLYELAYNGGRPFIEYCLHRYSTKESLKNWAERQNDGFVFNYAKTIVDLFNYYLTETDTSRQLGGLEDDEQWKMFSKDADLMNSDFVNLIDETQKLSSASGSIGILVNKPGGIFKNVQDEIDSGAYPYVALYSLPNIYDWKIERNSRTHRPILTYLKLREEDGSYLLWWPNKWEHWELDKKTNTPKLRGESTNPIGEIPFIWMPNVKRVKHSYLGVSDIVDISRIVSSIVRNLSCGEEVIKMAGFPMLRVPMEDGSSPEEGDDDKQEEVGVRAVHQFDPNYGDAAKPDWMPTEIAEPIEAILSWIDRKQNEIFRIAHLSGVAGQRTSNEAQSGLALRYNFRQLFSVLSKKSDNMVEAEYQIIRLWLKWQNKTELFQKIKISRSKEFSIDDLAVALDNAFTSMRNMASKTFRVKLQMKVASMMLPDLTDDERQKIENETNSKTPEEIPLLADNFHNETGGGAKVRPADQA